MMRRLAEPSPIREAFEFAARLRGDGTGREVFDLSIGNPAAPCPPGVQRALEQTAAASSPALHGYMDSAGYPDVRAALADALAQKTGLAYTADDLVMTAGAACAINTVMQAVLDPGDEVIVFAPYYPAYTSFCDNWDAVPVVVGFDAATMLPDLAALERALGPRTRLAIVNSPNNPSGLAWPDETARAVADALAAAQAANGRPLYLLADEPYRELLFDGAATPAWARHYRNTVVAYSLSKAASVPGERIGYAALGPDIEGKQALKQGICRSLGDLGFVNAPATAQRIAAACAHEAADTAYYDANRRTLCRGLREAGFDFVEPNGAFYLLLSAPHAGGIDGSGQAFAALLARHRIVVVDGAAFGCPRHVRVSFCADHGAIERSLAAFAAAAREIFGTEPPTGSTVHDQ